MIIKILLIILFLLCIYIIIDNFRINKRKIIIQIREDNLNEAVNNNDSGNNKNKNDNVKEKIKIIHISDFHNRRWLVNNNNFINKIREIKPDLIFISGDLIDHRKTNTDVVSKFIDILNQILNIKDSTNIEPKIFYVYGNHEKHKTDSFMKLYEDMLKSKNVRILKDEIDSFKFKDETINIIGLDDITIKSDELAKQYPEIKTSVMDYFTKQNELNMLNNDLIKIKIEELFNKNSTKLENAYNILLTHRPEAFEIYQEYSIKLVLAGHAHGGLVRIPFTDISLSAPNQGLIGKYTKGPYNKNGTTMYVNFGLGFSSIPIRIFATPEFFEIILE